MQPVELTRKSERSAGSRASQHAPTPCLTDNHARQEQVFEALSSYWNKGPEQIRRLLTEKAIQADDKRAHFIGIDAYLAAGGCIERDLFSDEDEG